MSEDEIDQLVLEALRGLASEGPSGTIAGKPVRLASGNEVYCIDKRIALWVVDKGVEIDFDTYDARVQQMKKLADALRRLKSANKVFINGGDPDEDSYWVTME